MIKEIVKDEEFLSQKSEKFIFGEDDYIIQDLIDTAEAHKDNCAGLAAPQIGYLKRVVIVRIGNEGYLPMINPVIFSKRGGTRICSEGCLSLEGMRDVKRHKEILYKYENIDGKTIVSRPIKGYLAQVIQHEVDHLNGVLI
jgi:peptide deformylase